MKLRSKSDVPNNIKSVEMGQVIIQRTEPDGRWFPGKVVYIHPQNRFYTLEFTMKSGEKFRESYFRFGYSSEDLEEELEEMKEEKDPIKEFLKLRKESAS